MTKDDGQQDRGPFSRLRTASVLIAARAGWLTWVDEDLVSQFRAYTRGVQIDTRAPDGALPQPPEEEQGGAEDPGDSTPQPAFGSALLLPLAALFLVTALGYSPPVDLRPLVLTTHFVFVLSVSILSFIGWRMWRNTVRRESIASMLRTNVVEERAVPLAVLLKDLGLFEPEGKKNLLAFLLPRSVALLLRQAGLDWESATLFEAVLLLGTFGFAAGWVVTPLEHRWLAVLPALAMGAAPFLYVVCIRARRLRALEDQFPEAVDFLSRALNAGHSFSAALEMTGREIQAPLGTEFRQTFTEFNLGLTIDIAFENLKQRVPLFDVRLLSSAVLSQRAAGGLLAEILGNLSSLVRERAHFRSQLRAAAARGRLWGVLLAAVPFGVGVMTYLLNPEEIRFLLNHSMGRPLLLLAACLTLAGYFAARRALTPGYLIVPCAVLLLAAFLLHALLPPGAAAVVSRALGRALLGGALAVALILAGALLRRVWRAYSELLLLWMAPLVIVLLAALGFSLLLYGPGGSGIPRNLEWLSLLAFLCLAVTLTFTGLSLFFRRNRTYSMMERVAGALEPAREPMAVLSVLNRLGSRVPAALTLLNSAARLLHRAGFRYDNAVPVFYGVKALLALALPAAGAAAMLALRANLFFRGLTLAALALTGFFLPNAYLRLRSIHRKIEIRSALPDLRDLLEIAIQSGLGLDLAIRSAAKELHDLYPETSEELSLFNLEMMAGKRRSEALRNLAARAGVDDLSRLVEALVQADRFGTSVAKTIHSHSAGMRTRAVQAAEETAALTDIRRAAVPFLCLLLTLVVITQPHALALRLTTFFRWLATLR